MTVPPYFKIRILGLLFVCLTSSAFAQVSPGKPLQVGDLVGKWVEVDPSSDKNFFNFYDDGHVEVQIQGTRLGGENAAGLAVKFRLNTRQTPAWLDLVAVLPNGQEIKRLKTLIEVVGPNLIRVAVSEDPDIRPTSFEGNGTASTGTLEMVK